MNLPRVPQAKSTITGTWSEGSSQPRASRRTAGAGETPAQRAGSPRHGRGAGRGRRRPSRAPGSSTSDRASRSAARNGAPRRPSRAGVCTPPCARPRPGVWLTTLSICLCDQTSFSSGATLRSPTMTFCGRPAARRREPARHLLQEAQLVGELRVRLRIGHVAAGRDVEIVQLHAARQRDDSVAAVAPAAPAPAARPRRTAAATGWRRRCSPSCRAMTWCR